MMQQIQENKDVNFLKSNQAILGKIYTEDPQTFLTWSYIILLGRKPDDQGALNYLDALNKGEDRLEILWQIYKSQEFLEFSNPSDNLSDSDYLQAAYRQCLLRMPDIAGFEAYMNELKSNKQTRNSIIHALYNSEEAAKSPHVQARRTLLPLLDIYDNIKFGAISYSSRPHSAFSRDASVFAALGKFAVAIEEISRNMITLLQTRSETNASQMLACRSDAKEHCELISTANQILHTESWQQAEPLHAENMGERTAAVVEAELKSNRPMRPECCGLIEGLVSVILPVYNQSNLISESIESVIGQTYQNYELIIINDGSSDGIEAVLERFLDHPKVYCYTQKNQRLPKALSNGFSFARGEFWTWTSADNIMEPRMLELLVAKLRAETNLGMTYADYLAIDDRGSILKDPSWRAQNRPNIVNGEIRLPRSTELLNVVQDNFIGPCFMYRGWIGRCLGDYDTQLGIEDYDYWMRINSLFSIRHLGDDSVLYRYRVHDNTLSARANEHKILEKVQRLMTYEKERAAFYNGKPVAYVADVDGRIWLRAHKVPDSGISRFHQFTDVFELAIVGSEFAENNISELLSSGRPVAVLINRSNNRYHKLVKLINSQRCVFLAYDKESADRVKLLSQTCPVFDARSPSTLKAIQAFAKNLLFIQSTRTAEELKREGPRLVSVNRAPHTVLQVDSFTQGGLENVVIDLALSLESSGYRVTIVNFGETGDAAKKAVERGLKFEQLPLNFSDEAYRAWLYEEGVDLVNAHYSTRGAEVCFNLGIPFIQTIHNSYVWLDQLQIEKYRTSDQYTSQYICVSMTAARYADVGLGLDVSKMRVIPNGIDSASIDITNIEKNRTSLRRAWGVEDDAPVYLNVASIIASKAQLPLVKAFAQVVKKFPKALLVLLGPVIEAPYQAELENAVSDLGLQGNVIMAGYDRNVSRYYHASDVFVLPSFWEGWSLSLAEALANGLSCVITDVGSAYEFESFDNVEVIDPPFGDIVLLNFRNIGAFVYGEDPAFEKRLAESLIKILAVQKNSFNISFAEAIDRRVAYQKYADVFALKINERT